MISRAQFRGHPLHVMLIPFPLAFLVGGFAADAGGLATDSDDLRLVAWYLIAAGLVAGVVTAIPGLIDYRFTVPPDSTGKKRATRHLMVNSSALILFALAWWLRGDPGVTPDTALVGLEAIAAGLLGIGGWLGGTLVHRNQIGIDHRYAGAGKWKEASFAEAPSIAVARADELKVNQMKLLRVGRRRIVLARADSGYVAFSDHCPHRGGSLADGVMACGTVTCPWHGSQFDVASGELRSGPATTGIETFPVEMRDTQVYLNLG
jgi:nitrite reductase/ring-hydroxylating ferredoxin subunit/uncharacterized membrane protein